MNETRKEQINAIPTESLVGDVQLEKTGLAQFKSYTKPKLTKYGDLADTIQLGVGTGADFLGPAYT